MFIAARYARKYAVVEGLKTFLHSVTKSALFLLPVIALALFRDPRFVFATQEGATDIIEKANSRIFYQ